MLNGIFGEGETRHIAHWQSVKLVDKSEEEEDGRQSFERKSGFRMTDSGLLYRGDCHPEITRPRRGETNYGGPVLLNAYLCRARQRRIRENGYRLDESKHCLRMEKKSQAPS